VGLVIVFGLFHWTATALGSDRGQAGVLVGFIVATATLAIQRAWFAPSLSAPIRELGLGLPRPTGVVAAAVISSLLLLLIPLYSSASGTSWTLESGAALLLPGLFAQAGIAEQLLFRGYLFGNLRRGRSFWRAPPSRCCRSSASVCSLTMPSPVTLAALSLGRAVVWMAASAVLLMFAFVIRRNAHDLLED